MTTSNNIGGSAQLACAAKLACAAQARLLWLRTVQIDDLTTRYLGRGDVRSARTLAATGADVSEACLHLMQQQEGG